MPQTSILLKNFTVYNPHLLKHRRPLTETSKVLYSSKKLHCMQPRFLKHICRIETTKVLAASFSSTLIGLMSAI